MSKILDLYKDILENKHRFDDEIFEAEIYKSAVPHLTIIDLGAFQGEFSFYCYNFADKIYAIEPDPTPYAVLKERVDKYSLDKIKLFPIALSNNSEDQNFFASGYGGSYLVGETNGEHIKVKCSTLAQFMKDNKIDHVDILKVDIEDGENAVFNSSDFKDVADKIDVIIGEHLGSVEQLLLDYGFKKTVVEGNNLLFKR